MIKRLALAIPAIRRLRDDTANLIADREGMAKKITELQDEIDLLKAPSGGDHSFYIPSGVYAGAGDAEYMKHSYPVASDFYHPKFHAFLKSFNNHPFQMHRKLWEFAFIVHKLSEPGMLSDGKEGLCFGSGQEPLPALFAAQGCTIKATDAPPEIVGEKWTESKEFASTLADMNYKGMIGEKEFFDRVSYETCDMNNISDHLTGFDFCWSACCLEHLGSLDHGLDFIENSLKTLKVGGLAVHTTELNQSSNEETVETGDTVLYRRKDIEAFIARMRDKGHEVEGLTITPPASPIDHHVDVPPYSHNPHLKIEIGKYVTTSVGIVVRRGT